MSGEVLARGRGVQMCVCVCAGCVCPMLCQKLSALLKAKTDDGPVTGPARAHTQNPNQTLIQIQVLWQVPDQPHLPVELSAIHMHSFSSAIK